MSDTQGAGAAADTSTGSMRIGGDGQSQDIGQVTRIGADGSDQSQSGAAERVSGDPAGPIDPDSLKSVDDWKAAYASGRLIGKPGEGAADTATGAAKDETVEGADKTPKAPIVPPTVTDPAFLAKAEPFTKEFTDTGTLSDKSLDAAATAFGMPKEMVQVYLTGLQASTSAASAQAVAPFHEAFGGAKQYEAFQGWAKDNLSAEEIAAYDEALDASPRVALQLAKTYQARYLAAGNQSPRDLSNGGSAPNSAEGERYDSWEQAKADMGKAEYQRDPAFRQKVQDKLSRSTFKY